MSGEKTISVEDAQDLVFGRPLANQEVSRHRWYTTRLIVYVDDTELRGFYYLDPASEIQEDQDRFESDPVKTFPVLERKVVTTTYVRAEET